MDIPGSPSYTWLLAMMYACFVWNHTASCSLKNRTPLEVLKGLTPDISPLLCFLWWSPLYYTINEEAFFGSDSAEMRGRFVGIAEHVGHAMTLKIFTKDTLKIIYHSCVCAAPVPALVNLHAEHWPWWCAYWPWYQHCASTVDDSLSWRYYWGENSDFLMSFVKPSDFFLLEKLSSWALKKMVSKTSPRLLNSLRIMWNSSK